MKFSFAMKSQTDMPDFCKEVCLFKWLGSDVLNAGMKTVLAFTIRTAVARASLVIRGHQFITVRVFCDEISKTVIKDVWFYAG